MTISMEPIGTVETKATEIPRHWSVSAVEGTLVIGAQYHEGLRDIRSGQRIVVLFHFHQSPPFTAEMMVQQPPHRDEPRGVFSICSPRRPNPIGMSVLEVLEVQGGRIRVRGLDMLPETPILDIKPHVTAENDCPSREGQGKN